MVDTIIKKTSLEHYLYAGSEKCSLKLFEDTYWIQIFEFYLMH